MLIITIIGNIGSGKSSASKMLTDAFSQKNFSTALLDFDLLGRVAFDKEEVQKKLKQTFGDFQNREDLAKIAFANEQNAELLNNIIHPEIENLYYMQLREYKHLNMDYVVLEQSVYTGKDDKFASQSDLIIGVVANREIRLQRCLDKNLSEEDFNNRDKAQLSQNKILENADIVISNNTSVEDLATRVSEVANIIIEKD